MKKKPEYKLRQEMYHHLKKPNDLLKDEFWIYTFDKDERIISDIIDYFTKPVNLLIYPGKSYAVAIIYAKLLRKYWDIPIMHSLKDPDLLYGNDRFFIPYTPSVSDKIYNHTLFVSYDPKLSQVAKTIDYFHEEFFLKPNQYFNNSHIINTTND